MGVVVRRDIDYLFFLQQDYYFLFKCFLFLFQYFFVFKFYVLNNFFARVPRQPYEGCT